MENKKPAPDAIRRKLGALLLPPASAKKANRHGRRDIVETLPDGTTRQIIKYDPAYLKRMATIKAKRAAQANPQPTAGGPTFADLLIDD